MEQRKSYEKAHALIEHIFCDVLPENGLVVREAQIALCHEMLDALMLNRIALCDAGVGIGKTHAYLVACLLWQIYRPAHLPCTVIISTSSVALQNAIVREYLPFLSRVLLKMGVIDKPIHAAVRKGKERFVCEARLSERLVQIRNKTQAGNRQKAALQVLGKTYDLDEAVDISEFDRSHVCVPPFCPHNCAVRDFCRYQQYLRSARGADVTVQVCNHNFLLADAEHRLQGIRPLLKEHHILVVDEAHKLPEAARQMYSRSVSQEKLRTFCRLLQREHLTREASRLAESQEALSATLKRDDRLEEEARVTFVLTPPRARALEFAVTCLRQLAAHLTHCLSEWMVRQLKDMADTLEMFQSEDPCCVLYVQYDKTGAPTLCAVSREVPAQLERALWALGKAAILTSGTLASGNSFTRIKQMLGLERNIRTSSFEALSPFNYKQNCLLYIPRDMPPPSNTKSVDILAQRIEELTEATYGHALVLFTSYRLMGEVHAMLQNRLPFPLLEAWRNGQQIIRLFKSLPNAVLFAAGPCWEGIDFPGDMVSLLVIARLPFPVPDPLSEAEQKQYPSLHDYIQTVVLPDMQRKLRQGFGRAIRTETDTCVVAILDQRAEEGQRYRNAVLEALPKCRITDNMEQVAQFIQEHKEPEYFV